MTISGKTLAQEKKAFLGGGYNAFYAAMTRGCAYAAKKSTPQNSAVLKAALYAHADKIINKSGYQKRKVSEKAHIANIENLAKHISDKCGSFLRRKQFRIGTAQKFFNLYLKVLWCKDEINEPPHCPFDRQILDALPAKELKGVCGKWTQLKDIADYKKWVEAFRSDGENLCAGAPSMAEWELRFLNLPTKRRLALVKKYKKARKNKRS